MKTIYTIILLLVLTLSGTSQVFRKNGPNYNVNYSLGIIQLHSSADGDLYLNDVFLTGVLSNDTIYIINIEPGNYVIQLKSADFTSPRQNVAVAQRKIIEVGVSKDSISEKKASVSYARTTQYIAGKPVVFVREKAVYLNVNRGLMYARNGFAFMGTYQLIPEFCPGIGFFNYYDRFDNVHLLPIYLHIVSHFGSGKIAPYVKLDLGTQIVLNDPKTPGFSNWKKEVHPGLYFSPGIGFRFAIIKNLSGIAEIDYRRMKYTINHFSDTDSYEYHYSGGSFFEISVGLGYQF